MTPNSRFRDDDGWNSLKGFSIMVLMEQEYGRDMTADEFQKCETVGDLAAFAGVA